SDERPVMLKRNSTEIHPHEVEISQLFSSDPHDRNPRNHCITILEAVQDTEDADKQLIVMPRFMSFDEPILETVGEVIDCFGQIFE
ncbi:hypothetical protein DFH07DRAFT_708545, partial [Mycena maculata]